MSFTHMTAALSPSLPLGLSTVCSALGNSTSDGTSHNAIQSPRNPTPGSKNATNGLLAPFPPTPLMMHRTTNIPIVDKSTGGTGTLCLLARAAMPWCHAAIATTPTSRLPSVLYSSSGMASAIKAITLSKYLSNDDVSNDAGEDDATNAAPWCAIVQSPTTNQPAG
jgi:hypothetical protein